MKTKATLSQLKNMSLPQIRNLYVLKYTTESTKYKAKTNIEKLNSLSKNLQIILRNNDYYLTKEGNEFLQKAYIRYTKIDKNVLSYKDYVIKTARSGKKRILSRKNYYNSVNRVAKNVDEYADLSEFIRGYNKLQTSFTSELKVKLKDIVDLALKVNSLDLDDILEPKGSANDSNSENYLYSQIADMKNLGGKANRYWNSYYKDLADEWFEDIYNQLKDKVKELIEDSTK